MNKIIQGNLIQIKSKEEILEIETDNKISNTRFLDDTLFGSNVVISKISSESIEFYTKLDIKWKLNTMSLPIEYFNFIDDDRKPSQESYDLVKILIDMNYHIFISTCGNRGRSKSKLMTKKNTYACFDIDGNSVIHFPVCTFSHMTYDLDTVKELIKNSENNDVDGVDMSIDTGGSYITQEVFLYSPEMAKDKSFEY